MAYISQLFFVNLLFCHIGRSYMLKFFYFHKILQNLAPKQEIFFKAVLQIKYSLLGKGQLCLKSIFTAPCLLPEMILSEKRRFFHFPDFSIFFPADFPPSCSASRIELFRQMNPKRPTHQCSVRDMDRDRTKDRSLVGGGGNGPIPLFFTFLVKIQT